MKNKKLKMKGKYYSNGNNKIITEPYRYRKRSSITNGKQSKM